MSRPQVVAESTAAIERSAARIEAHLVRLVQGHDPFGHLFAIERLARCARAEWLAIERESDRELHRP